MFSEKFKAFMKANYLLVLSFFFMYILPLILLMVLACEGKSASISLKLWGSVVGVVLIIAYIIRFKKFVHDRKQFEKTEQLRIPVWLRVLSMLISMVGFAAVILFLSTVKDMFNEIIIFVCCAMASVFVSHILLIIDSKKRIAHKVTRE